MKDEGVYPEVSLWAVIFVSVTLLPGFISSTPGSSLWPGQEHQAPFSVVSPGRVTQTFGTCFANKVWFRAIFFRIEVSVMFCDVPRRLPSVCLGRGWYEFTFP